MANKNDQPYKGKAHLNILFGDDDLAESPDKLLRIDLINLPDSQPRRYFDTQGMQSLVESIKTDGILQPLLVRPIGNNQYELVAGERRYRAARVVGLKEVPVIVRELTSQQALHLALVENLQREDLNPVEETEGILQLLTIQLDCQTQEAVRLLYRMQNWVQRGTDIEGKDNVILPPDAQEVKKVFADLGRMSWESFVSNRLPLLRLPEDILDALRTGRIEYSKARAIAKVEDVTARKSLLETAINEELPLTQIKSKVAALKSGNSSEPVENLKTKIKATLNLACKSKAWHDPKKQKKFQKILAELESLLGE